ncbi:YhcG family protein [Flavimarina sp. Hel_I_48]|uniref:PDDEXK nuclease domain-containing protein n=1 Tax=Flavimarina sp. Hel_I_48 TaxID=1392488 RepID=UPI0004DED875|nr:PDDEXK nuclease domain-containing protein [Flavimarina sp. Hel_I_48]
MLEEEKIKTILFEDISQIIERGRKQLSAKVNSTLTMVYWQVGNRINDVVLDNERAVYGKETVVAVSAQLEVRYGRSFAERNVRRMMQLALVFPDLEIVSQLATQLSWSHFIELLPLKKDGARMFYASKAAEETWGRNELRHQIDRKAFERREIAQIQFSEQSDDLQTSFKDPYFLEFLGLKEGYMENNLEEAILKELELFILELGKGFAFVERQKRMILDGDDFYLDLLFFHRKLKRLVAIELKLGKFIPAHKGQMELYLKWLNRFEKQEGENPAIGLILCAEKSNEQVELLEMGKEGIMVAEYWTELPPRDELEAKLHSAMIEAREHLERKKLL